MIPFKAKLIRRLLIAGVVSFALSGNAAAFGGQITDSQCDQIASPEAAPESAEMSTPADVLAGIDEAYLTLHGLLSHASSDLATLALEDLERTEMQEFANQQIVQSEVDRQALARWADESIVSPGSDLNVLLAVVATAKMELDLPAGEGGTESFGGVVAVGLICTTSGPYDDIYLTSSIDLAQQSIDLAQVAIVFSTHPEIAEFANSVVDRETATIGQLLAWQNAWATDPATPID